jgi:hypothetical protein
LHQLPRNAKRRKFDKARKTDKELKKSKDAYKRRKGIPVGGWEKTKALFKKNKKQPAS